MAGAFLHHPGGRYLAGLFGCAEGPHTLTAPGVAGVAGQWSALPIPVYADDQQMAVGRHRAHGDNLVLVQQPDAPDAAGGAGPGGQPGDWELDSLTLLRNHDHVFGFAHLGHRDQLIALFQVKHDEPGGAYAGEFARFQGFYLALLGGQQKRVLVSGVIDDEHGLYRLSPVKGQQVGQQHAPAGARRVTVDLISLQGVYPSPVGEEEQGVVGVDDYQVHHCVVFPGPHPQHALAAAVLGAEGIRRHSLHVALLAQGDYGVLMRNE